MKEKKAAPSVAHGKAFEKKVHEACRHLYLELPILWERVIDSHDAGNVVKSADSDFKLLVQGPEFGNPFVFHIECKASVKYASLAEKGAIKSLMKSGQVAKLRLAERAGVFGIVLFHNVTGRTVENWDAREVCSRYLGAKPSDTGIDGGASYVTFPEDSLEREMRLFVEQLLK